jgi:hypothetical protein
LAAKKLESCDLLPPCNRQLQVLAVIDTPRFSTIASTQFAAFGRDALDYTNTELAAVGARDVPARSTSVYSAVAGENAERQRDRTCCGPGRPALRHGCPNLLQVMEQLKGAPVKGREWPLKCSIQLSFELKRFAA